MVTWTPHGRYAVPADFAKRSHPSGPRRSYALLRKLLRPEPVETARAGTPMKAWNPHEDFDG